MQGMADLYRIKPDLLKQFIKSAIVIEPLRPSHAPIMPVIEPLKPSPYPRFILDGYLSGFLQDRDRSQLHYCDPMLQHISICRRFLSLLDESSAIDFQS